MIDNSSWTIYLSISLIYQSVGFVGFIHYSDLSIKHHYFEYVMMNN